MKFIKFPLLILCAIMLTNCASSYHEIKPETIVYGSDNTDKNVILEYKYDLLRKKYTKKELKKGVKLVAVKITNHSDRDLVFGKDIKLNYASGNEIYIYDNESVFKTLKQKPATYLLYLLLTPVNIFTTETNSYGGSEVTNTIPVGLILGPGLAGGNMIAASTANKKFKTEMLDYKITGTLIKKGETVYGLIGIETANFDAIKIEVN